MKILNLVGPRIRRIRVGKRWSQKRLAEALQRAGLDNRTLLPQTCIAGISAGTFACRQAGVGFKRFTLDFIRVLNLCTQPLAEYSLTYEIVRNERGVRNPDARS